MQVSQLQDSCHKQSLNFSIKSQSSAKASQNQNDESQSSQDHQKHKFSSGSSLHSYKQILSEVQSNHRSLSELLFELKKHGISYNQNYLTEQNSKNTFHQARIVSMKHTKHFQVVTLNVSLGPFSQELRIYNTFSSQFLKSIHQLYSEKNTEIYCFENNCKMSIAKTKVLQKFQAKNFFKNKQQFFSVIRENFIGKMMSILEIGPKFCEQFGFDIFLSETKAYFFFEYCQNSKDKPFDEKDALSLKKILREMHALSLIHRDIKPDNIMYSPTFKKYVFIDFEMSEFRTENPGQLVFTKFSGTYPYCIEELKKIFQSKQSSWVDLHWNDAYGLDQSLKELKSTYSSDSIQIQNDIVSSDIPQQDILEQVKLKYFFLTLKNQESQQIQRISEVLYGPLMTFFYQIPLSQKIRKIYLDHLEDYGSYQKGFQDLKEIFSKKIYYSSFKGKRNFKSMQEKIEIKNVQQFYEKLYFLQNPKKQKRNLQIKKIEEILLEAKQLSDLKPFQYERFLVEFLSFKRMGPAISVERKIQACKAYSKLKNFQIKKMNPHEVFEQIFHEILLAIPTNQIKKKFSVYLMALDNYVILSENMNIKIFEQILQVIELIENEQKLSFIEKIQYTLMIYMSAILANNGIFNTEIYIKLMQIEEMIKTKVVDWASIQKKKGVQSQDLQICEIYVSYISYFSLENTCSLISDFDKIQQKIRVIEAKSPLTSLLLNFLEYRLLCNVQDLDSISAQRREKEDLMLQQMQSKCELNYILIHTILFYAKTMEIKMFKKYIGILDNCYQLQSIYIKNFESLRLNIEFLQYDQSTQQNIRQSQLQNIEKKMKQYCLDQVNEQNLLISFKKMNNFYFIYHRLISLGKPLSPFLNQLYIKVSESIPIHLKIYQSLNLQILYRGSKNYFYLALLMQDIQFRARKIINNQKNNSKQKLLLDDRYYLKLCQIFPQLQSFHKITKLDRSTFNDQDHTFLLFYDIIWLKYSSRQSWLQNIIDFLTQKTKFMSSMFLILKFQQRNDIQLALRQVLSFLSKEHDIQVHKKVVDVVYPIVENKLFIEGNLLNFNSILINAMIKASRFEQIFYEIVQTSKFYTDHLSNFQIIQLDKIYFMVINNFYQEKKQRQFYIHLNDLLTKIKIKKIPIFSMFLIYCIQPSNISIIVQKIISSLPFLKPNGIRFLLSRFYNHLVKSQEYCPLSKKIYYLKKYVRYPSKQTQNIEKIKYHLNCETRLSSFQGVFNKILEQKILRLRKYCEIYPKKKILFNDHIIKGGRNVKSC